MYIDPHNERIWEEVNDLETGELLTSRAYRPDSMPDRIAEALFPLYALKATQASADVHPPASCAPLSCGSGPAQSAWPGPA